MTENSRNQLRGYGSLPEGVEPTEQIADHQAGGDPSSFVPAPVSPAHHTVPSQPSPGRPAHPWSAPPATVSGPYFAPRLAPPAGESPWAQASPRPEADPWAPQSATPSSGPPQDLDGWGAQAAPPANTDDKSWDAYVAQRPAAAAAQSSGAYVAERPAAAAQSSGADSWDVLPEPPTPAEGAGEPTEWNVQPENAAAEWNAQPQTGNGAVDGHGQPGNGGVAVEWSAQPHDSGGPVGGHGQPENGGAVEWNAQPHDSGGALGWVGQPESGGAGGWDASAQAANANDDRDGGYDPYGADWPGAASVAGPVEVRQQPEVRPQPEVYPARDPYGLPEGGAPRIAPTPPPPAPTRLFMGLLIGLLAGLLVFGTAAFFLGRTTAGGSTAAANKGGSTTTGKGGSAAAGKGGSTTADKGGSTTAGKDANTAQALGLFEQNQARLNQKDFKGTPLATIAQGWLPYLSTCGRGTPRAGEGEKLRVRCTIDGMSALFIEYKSTAERDKARRKTQEQDAAALAPGAQAPRQTRTPSGRTTGNYVEYAYRLTEGGVTRTVAGIWWDDAQTPIAGYLLAYWKDGVGERWEPMRDLWSRYA
ncbi:hypothetical protein ACQP2F_39215 [Actinoplanes sp. CA-030573]|uniref:hypothetical protein n=1 Tax=Actinoplanes sp. CA-030573 TaxID=3239898 RepID=UPI003D8AA0E8